MLIQEKYIVRNYLFLSKFMLNI